MHRIEGVDIVVAGEGEGLALGADPRGPADAMHIVLGVLRQVEVDDVGDAVDVQPAARDVGGDENRQLAVAEVVQDLEPLGLHDVSGETAGGEAVPAQVLDEAACGVLGVEENHDPFPALSFEQTEEEGELLVGRDVIQLLVHRIRSELLAIDDDLGRVRHLTPPELHDPPRQGGGEHEGLAFVGVGEAMEQPSEVLGETHVEKPVTLVDDDHFGVAQRIGSLAVVIDEASGGADEQVDTLGETVFLFPVVDAAEDHVDPAGRVGREFLGVRGDLDRELAGRSDDESAGILDLRCPLPPQDPGEEREKIGCGLARSGLGLSDDVPSLEGERKNLRLNSGQPLEAEVVDRREELLRQVDVGKSQIGKKRVGNRSVSHGAQV